MSASEAVAAPNRWATAFRNSGTIAAIGALGAVAGFVVARLLWA